MACRVGLIRPLRSLGYRQISSPLSQLNKRGICSSASRHIDMSAKGFPIENDLPVPVDDGACDHLSNSKLPDVSLSSTSGSSIAIADLKGLNIIFTYPRTGAPGENIPDEWNAIPGARGCSPQACSFRDAMNDLRAQGVKSIFGLSTQDTAYQSEAKVRLHLSYDLLSDEKLEFTNATKFPTFEYQGKTLTKRTVLMIEDGKIVKCFYPVFPSDAAASMALGWLKEKSGSS